MSKNRMRAAALLAAGAVAGGVSAASLSAHADDTSAPTTQAGQTGSEGPGFHGPGERDGHGPGFGADAAELAKALGVSESKLTKALDAVRADLEPDASTRPEPGERPTPPTEAERAQHEAAFARALAKELGTTQAKVSAALAKVRATHEAEHRSDLSDRLDAAVKAGDLTAADKASVLKAFDAGVLDGPH
ncbi:MAG TPA: hypothetical protein VNS81_01445 [Nocardioides sp.]|nr:hypothetical protein [Nocardioides sp.]